MDKKSIVAFVLIALIILAGNSGIFTGMTVQAEELESPYFELQIIDSMTGKGIPMTEVYRNGLVRFVTDSDGRVAINDPDLLNQKVYFDIKSDGYKPASDNAMSPGVIINVVPGGKWEVKLSREDAAERIYRLTGSGVYRDSVILGYKPPIEMPLSNSGVTRHNSFIVKNKPLTDAQSIVYKSKIFWFFNGVQGLTFSKKNNKMAVATAQLPQKSGMSPEEGVNLEYITDSNDFPKEMAPFGDESDLVCFDSVMTVPDSSDNEKLVAHYIIFDSKMNQKEHGLAIFNDEKEVFEVLKTFNADEEWRFPQGRTCRVEEDGKEWIYFSNPFPNKRVPATLDALQDPASYEAWTCYGDTEGKEVKRTDSGALDYRWTKDASPVGPAEEKSLIRKKLIEESEAMFLPKDKEGNQIEMLSGSFHYNQWREKWVFIGAELRGKPSLYGQVWYSESQSLTGPWEKAVKIASHSDNSFFNVAHNEFFNQAKGRVLYFHGTYTKELSANSIPMPMYEGNQVMYRLELNSREIESVFKPMNKELTEIETYEPAGDEEVSNEDTKEEKERDKDNLTIILIGSVILVILVAVYIITRLRRA